VAVLSDVRTALANAVDNVPGLRASASVPGQVSPPIAVVIPARGTFLTYSVTSEQGVADMSFEVVLLVSYADDRAGQLLLDGYLSATGPNSVRAAVAADPTLGKVVDYAIVTDAADYGLITWGTETYLGARLLVTAGTE
jgi:hypothetical protein